MPAYTSETVSKMLTNKEVTKIKTIQGYVVWWCTHTTSTLERQRQKDGDFEAIQTIKLHLVSKKQNKKPNQITHEQFDYNYVQKTYDRHKPSYDVKELKG